jgi:hypothetical protein
MNNIIDDYPELFSLVTNFVSCFDIIRLRCVSKSINKIVKKKQCSMISLYEIYGKKNNKTFGRILHDIMYYVTDKHILCIIDILKSKHAKRFKTRKKCCKYCDINSIFVNKYQKCVCCTGIFYKLLMSNINITPKIISAIIKNGFNNNINVLKKGLQFCDVDAIKTIINKSDKNISKKIIIKKACKYEKVEIIKIFNDEYNKICGRRVVKLKDIIYYLLTQKRININITYNFIIDVFDYYNEFEEIDYPKLRTILIMLERAIS